jgi:Cd2+/Zn2+-exporting ATPase
VVKNGIIALLKGNFTMNFLMTIAVLGSFLIGSGAEGAVVIFLFYIALYLENYAGERARKSIAALLKLVPETAALKKDGMTSNVHVHDVKTGDILVVKPGDKVPLDGKVIKGSTSINQAAITGESMPVNKDIGDDIFAGTLNHEGYIEMEVTKESDQTVLSKIVNLVKESQKKRSNTENFIDKLAKYYTPAVIALAALVAIIPVVLFGQSLDEWVYRALVLLIISCPCAFLLSTPVAMVSGITASTKNGVLIKGSRYVEEMDRIKVMVFDKTGTLTQGNLELTDVIAMNNYSEEEILRVSGSLESNSNHPIANAINSYVEGEGVKLSEVKDFKSITGNGLSGTIDKKPYILGKKNLFRNNYEFPDKFIRELEDEGKTVVLVANETLILGLIGMRDKVRIESKNTISQLKSSGIKTVMLTGDNERAAKTVADDIGLDEYHAELLPEDKVKIIEKYIDNEIGVAMVGDGVNDAPALARSNVGIAMGAAGSDVAIETADIALMHDDISKLNYLLKLSRKTMTVVKQNVSVALIIQVSLSVLAVLGYVSLWMAVTFGDMGLTLAVILNSLRLVYTK